ncbi:helix-turn-helix transcriptional regulator [Sporolactobacillus kofuensis]|uniref:Helix-turn-helix transcriptional regulator n=1 Tax=Sporolactobacillus kofuensis TaxID=269672 RepID=A0ABW1WC43_9BACL|nr:helix-turn-helix transcriptional regulator [Sporolactobacillus kofuensis]MCO7175528.1 helix-turn-helix domain-containing protein [Sporolactobacillus kofuensis]
MRYTIAQARILAGLTQVKMAERLGMSEKTYIQYEKYRKVFRMNDGMNFSRITGIKLDSIIFFNPKLQINCSEEEVG